MHDVLISIVLSSEAIIHARPSPFTQSVGKEFTNNIGHLGGQGSWPRWRWTSRDWLGGTLGETTGTVHTVALKKN